MKILLNYGQNGYALVLPEGVMADVIEKPVMPVLSDPGGTAKAALESALTKKCEEVFEQASGTSRDASRRRKDATVCIAICDITRPVPNSLFLRPMIEVLLANGIDQKNVTILVATGLHRPNLGQELEELIGDPWVQENVRVKNHDARNDQDHVLLGKTQKRGTVVRIDKEFVNADIRIVTGLVEPHFMAGYSGGRKVIAPGLAHAETITTFHSSRFMADPAAVSCNLVGNPLHEEQLEIVQLVGGAMGLNTVLDDQRRLSFLNFGEIIVAHEDAVDFVRSYCQVTVSKRYSTVVTTAAGYPLDKTYYQTIKGMVGGMNILEPGGDLIIASECSEGFGSPEFMDAQRRLVELGPDAFLTSLLGKTHADVDEWQTQMQLKPMAIGKIHLYCPLLKESEWALTGVNRVDSIEQAISESVRKHRDPRIAVIPEGPYVEPRVGLL